MNGTERIVAWFEDLVGTDQATVAATDAVRKVVELHAPEEFRDRLFCQHCLANDGEQEYYPCRTVQVVSGAIRGQDPSFALGGSQ